MNLKITTLCIFFQLILNHKQIGNHIYALYNLYIYIIGVIKAGTVFHIDLAQIK